MALQEIGESLTAWKSVHVSECHEMNVKSMRKTAYSSQNRWNYLSLRLPHLHTDYCHSLLPLICALIDTAPFDSPEYVTYHCPITQLVDIASLRLCRLCMATFLGVYDRYILMLFT